VSRAIRAAVLFLTIGFTVWLAYQRAKMRLCAITWRTAMNALIKRLKEPSSWAALAAGLVVLGVNLDPGLLSKITTAGTGLAALAAFLMPEAGSDA
jgi:hypothetical protein